MRNARRVGYRGARKGQTVEQARSRNAAGVFAVLIAVLLTGCGSDEPTVEDLDEPKAEDLIGTWVSDNVTMEVTGDRMTATISGVLEEEAVVESTYTATSTTLEIVDESGPIACSPDQVGTYEWEDHQRRLVHVGCHRLVRPAEHHGRRLVRAKRVTHPPDPGGIQSTDRRSPRGVPGSGRPCRQVSSSIWAIGGGMQQVSASEEASGSFW